MNEEQRDRDEERQPRRPRVVDKRIAARAAGSAPAEGDVPRDEAPPGGGDVRAPGEGPGPVRAPGEGAGVAGVAPGDEETFRPPPREEPRHEAPARPEVWTPEQEAEAQRIAAEIERVPARDWVINSAMNLVNVASVKLDRSDLAGSQLAIDALAAILNATGARLGDAHAPLREVLAQLQMAYAQAIQPAGGAGPGAPGSPG